MKKIYFNGILIKHNANKINTTDFHSLTYLWICYTSQNKRLVSLWTKKDPERENLNNVSFCKYHSTILQTDAKTQVSYQFKCTKRNKNLKINQEKKRVINKIPLRNAVHFTETDANFAFDAGCSKKGENDWKKKKLKNRLTWRQSGPPTIWWMSILIRNYLLIRFKQIASFFFYFKLGTFFFYCRFNFNSVFTSRYLLICSLNGFFFCFSFFSFVFFFFFFSFQQI